MAETIQLTSSSSLRYHSLLAIIYHLIRFIGKTESPDSLFTPLRTILGFLRTMHVRHAMIAAGDVAVLADLSDYSEQAIAILKEVRSHFYHIHCYILTLFLFAYITLR